MGCLYQLTSPSGKSYIGISSKDAKARFDKHVEHALGKRQNGVIYSALRKYGADSFVVKTLVIADDWAYLCDLERKAIVAFGTRYPAGYNMTDGGEGVIGPKPEGFAEKVSVAQKRRYQRPDQRAKLAECAKKANKVVAEKWAAQRINGLPKWVHIARSKRTRLGSPEQKEKSSAAIIAAMKDPIIREKMLACAARRAADPEWRKRISASKRGKSLGPMNDEHKRKIAEARRREWQDPVIRERRLAALAKAREARK